MSKGRSNNRRKRNCRVCQNRGMVWHRGHRRRCKACSYYAEKQPSDG
jgi:hypothetical protein